jgi:hypothetical protein
LSTSAISRASSRPASVLRARQGSDAGFERLDLLADVGHIGHPLNPRAITTTIAKPSAIAPIPAATAVMASRICAAVMFVI